jgi:hypothetical protein
MVKLGFLSERTAATIKSLFADAHEVLFGINVVLKKKNTATS